MFVGLIFVHTITINSNFGLSNVIFLGYIDLHNGYKCLDISIGRLYIPHAVLDDNILPIIANLHPDA
jgi:hypothetical protein